MPKQISVDFENNFVISKLQDSLFFLNTSGELYSINYSSQKINWIINFRGASLPGDTKLFLSQPVVVKNNSLIISTENAILHYNTMTSFKNWSFPSNAILKPILTSNYTYLLSANNLLISVVDC